MQVVNQLNLGSGERRAARARLSPVPPDPNASHHIASHLTSPQLTSPQLTSPHLTSPHILIVATTCLPGSAGSRYLGTHSVLFQSCPAGRPRCLYLNHVPSSPICARPHPGSSLSHHALLPAIVDSIPRLAVRPKKQDACPPHRGRCALMSVSLAWAHTTALSSSQAARPAPLGRSETCYLGT